LFSRYVFSCLPFPPFLLRPPCLTLFPYTTLFRSRITSLDTSTILPASRVRLSKRTTPSPGKPLPSSAKRVDSSKNSTPEVSSESDRKSTRLNSSHVSTSYAVFCLKKKIQPTTTYL